MLMLAPCSSWTQAPVVCDGQVFPFIFREHADAAATGACGQLEQGASISIHTNTYSALGEAGFKNCAGAAAPFFRITIVADTARSPITSIAVVIHAAREKRQAAVFDKAFGF